MLNDTLILHQYIEEFLIFNTNLILYSNIVFFFNRKLMEHY